MWVVAVINWSRRAHPTVAKQVLLGYITKLTKYGSGSKPASNVSLWFVLQVPP